MLPVYYDFAIPTRRAILAVLLPGAKNVGQIVQETGFKQPNVSNHLAKMRSLGTLAAHRRGREIFYRFGGPEVEAAIRFAVQDPARQHDSFDMADLAHLYAMRATEGDEQACREIVEAVLRSEAPVIDLYEDVIATAMRLIGSRFGRGDIDEACEHIASGITERMLAKIDAHTLARPNGLKALVGCASGNRHAFGARMVADYLKHVGWQVVYLGADVPTPAFVNSVSVHRPHAVFVSATEGDQQLLHGLRGQFSSLAIFVGGRGGAMEEESLLSAGASAVFSSLRTLAMQLPGPAPSGAGLAYTFQPS